MLTTCHCLLIFQICVKKFQNWVHLCFGEVLKLKLSKGELIISNSLEMADTYLLGGGRQPPLPLIRVNILTIILVIYATLGKRCYALGGHSVFISGLLERGGQLPPPPILFRIIPIFTQIQRLKRSNSGHFKWFAPPGFASPLQFLTRCNSLAYLYI